MKISPRRIIVRSFDTADADVVLAMMQDLAFLRDDTASTSATDIVRHASGPGRISTILVAVIDGVVCGFSATYDWMNYVHGFPVRNIDLLYVQENARRCGVGRALLKSIARDAKRSSCQRVTVGADPMNEAANAFYRRMGFDLRPAAVNRYAISGGALDRLTVT